MTRIGKLSFLVNDQNGITKVIIKNPCVMPSFQGLQADLQTWGKRTAPLVILNIKRIKMTGDNVYDLALQIPSLY